MASADLSFTKDGLIYRPQHQEDEEEEDFLTERQQKDGGAPEKIMQQLPTFSSDTYSSLVFMGDMGGAFGLP